MELPRGRVHRWVGRRSASGSAPWVCDCVSQVQSALMKDSCATRSKDGAGGLVPPEVPSSLPDTLEDLDRAARAGRSLVRLLMEEVLDGMMESISYLPLLDIEPEASSHSHADVLCMVREEAWTIWVAKERSDYRDPRILRVDHASRGRQDASSSGNEAGLRTTGTCPTLSGKQGREINSGL